MATTFEFPELWPGGDPSKPMLTLPTGSRPVTSGPQATPIPPAVKELNDYGKELIKSILNDYRQAVSKWRTSFEEVLAAYSTAIRTRNDTLEEAERERQANAAIGGLVLGLMTAGAMRLLGGYLQYDYLPNKFRTHTTKVVWDFLRLADTERVTVEFSRLQAALFGGLVQDLGNKLVPLIFPKPKAVHYQLDTWDGVNNLRADLLGLIDGSTSAVTTQFEDADRKLRDDPSFGQGWLEHSKSVKGNPKVLMYQHFDKLRRRWANEWEYYGKTPAFFSRDQLARAYERGLWAAYAFSKLEKFAKMSKSDRNDFDRQHRDDREVYPYWASRFLPDAVVQRFKEVNIVLAQTQGGRETQVIYGGLGDPNPTMDVGHSLEQWKEVDQVYAWAEGFLKNAPRDTLRQFFPPSKPRALGAL